MTAQAPAESQRPRRTGRPPKRPDSVPTRDRLIAAAIEVFVERGFGQANITAIAERAGISGPAVYKHFDGKIDLLMQAARHSLDSVSGTTRDRRDRRDRSPVETARRWLSPGFAQTRRLILELHLAADRETELFAMLAEWHREQAAAWTDVRADRPEQIKAFYLLLLGLSQVDVLAAIDADPARLGEQVDRMVGALFPDDPPSPETTTDRSRT